jgi:hypothetical protein
MISPGAGKSRRCPGNETPTAKEPQQKPEKKPEKKPDDYYGPVGVRFNGEPITSIWTGFGYRKIKGT